MENQGANSSNQENNETSCPETLESFTAAGFKLLVEATKKSNNLPSGRARNLYECSPSFHTIVKSQADYVLSKLSMILSIKGKRGNIQKRDDDDDKFEMIVDVNDALLENVGILLDELSGIKRTPDVNLQLENSEAGSSGQDKLPSGRVASQVLNKVLNQTRNIDKPQERFNDKVDNDANKPFEPRIKYKYNMLKPLALILEKCEDGISQFSHPYEFELEKFKPLPEQLIQKPPVIYKSIESTPLVLVNTPEEVNKMVEELEKCKEIAVDLEHHSYRSFQGFTCLMQISTRDTDYIIDTMELRSDLEILNKVFTNPSIVKVFHGADMDMIWLQKDFALYIVNMFDTHQAVRMLDFPKLSLAYLLSHYCNYTTQKQFQLADWRIRPLPPELITYARADTHFLLFIYDNVRNALIEKANGQTNLLESVISESTRICLQRYVKPCFQTDGYLDLYHRSKKLFDNRQKFALQKLYEWRDKTARELDESYDYVLPDHMMLNISEVLPREAQGILACCNPVPIPVRQNLLVLHQIIYKARDQPLIKPILEEQRLFKKTPDVHTMTFHCPHDLNHEGEFRDDLPVLFGSNNIQNPGKNNTINYEDFICTKPWIDVFEKKPEKSEKDKLASALASKQVLTPYQRYKLSTKYAESIEEKTLKKTQKKEDEKVPEGATETLIDLTTVKIEQESKNTVGKTKKTVDNTKKIVPNTSGDKSKTTEETTKTPVGKTKKTVEPTESISKEPAAKKEKKINKTPESSNKRKLEEEKVKPAKKLKEEVSDVDTTPTTLKEAREESLLKKKKKKKLVIQKKKKGFKPFDYSAVDLKKYQTSTSGTVKKTKKKCKMSKKSGKKNYGISI